MCMIFTILWKFWLLLFQVFCEFDWEFDEPEVYLALLFFFPAISLLLGAAVLPNEN